MSRTRSESVSPMEVDVDIPSKPSALSTRVYVRTVMGTEHAVTLPADATLADLTERISAELHLSSSPPSSSSSSSPPASSSSSVAAALASSRVATAAKCLTVTFGDRVLQPGRLADQGVVDGSRVTVQPTVKTGLNRLAAPPVSLSALSSALPGGIPVTQEQISTMLATGQPLRFSVPLDGRMVQVELKPEQLGVGAEQLEELKEKLAQQTKTHEAIRRAAEAAKVAAAAATGDEDAQREHRRMVAQFMDESKAQAKAEKRRERENKTIENKFDRLRDRMQQRKLRRRRSSPTAVPASKAAVKTTTAAAAAQSKKAPVVTGFAGLRRGFLL